MYFKGRGGRRLSQPIFLLKSGTRGWRSCRCCRDGERRLRAAATSSSSSSSSPEFENKITGGFPVKQTFLFYFILFYFVSTQNQKNRQHSSTVICLIFLKRTENLKSHTHTRTHAQKSPRTPHFNLKKHAAVTGEQSGIIRFCAKKRGAHDLCSRLKQLRCCVTSRRDCGSKSFWVLFL